MYRRFSLVLIALFALLNANAQRESLDLSGQWHSSLGECQLPGTTDENRLGGGNHATDVTTQLTRLYPYSGKVVYEREVDIPASMQGQRLTLYMERTKPSTLWVDGDSIGSICQLYAPHVYELPALSAGKHQLKIRIDNSDEVVPEGVRGSHAWTDATQTNWNGILGRFCLEATPNTYINSVKTYPDLQRKGVKVKVEIVANQAQTAQLVLSSERQQQAKVQLKKGLNRVEQFLPLGDNLRLWSEFHPSLYTLKVTLTSKKGIDEQQTSFGMREFGTQGTQFVINGNKTFLRGTHDACVFPLTGYAPTDVESWRNMFRIAKQYGINHYRFHSYTPTDAAFTAADLEGIYLHTELPMWGTINPTTTEINDFLRHEAFTLLEFLGNHPSMVSVGLGNELSGDTDMMRQWLDDFRRVDDRHLYCMGSNNHLGWQGPKEGEDFFITCRVGGAPNDGFTAPWAKELNRVGFGSHARTSFSFADADQGGILNGMRPNTLRSFANVVPLCPTPIVSHETCQFQIYPDYSEIPKFTGVLYPYNHEIFRERLRANGLTPQLHDFHQATGKWAVECYKADMEYCLRTPGFGGYQLLDIKDYPGQGSALVGILDAFMDSKGLITPAAFAGFNSPVVPMAQMDSYCYLSTDELHIDLVLSNYEENDYRKTLYWTLEGNEIHESGQVNNVFVAQGNVTKVGEIQLKLNQVTHPQALKLTLKTAGYCNEYELWVYPVVPTLKWNNVTVVDSLSDSTLKNLLEGGTVLLTPAHASIEKQSVGGLFTPDYWNYAMFKSISENINKPVSPGTLGMLMDKQHPLFQLFPTDGYSNWQWWSIALNSRPLILNQLPAGYRPLIQTVDNVERNHKLGILMEFKVGKGRLMICTTDLKAISEYPEGQWFAEAIRAYMNSESFNPTTPLTVAELEQLLYTETTVRDIQGVKNISSYAHED